MKPKNLIYKDEVNKAFRCIFCKEIIPKALCFIDSSGGWAYSSYYITKHVNKECKFFHSKEEGR